MPSGDLIRDLHRWVRELESWEAQRQAVLRDLRRSEERARGLLESAPDAVVIVDQGGAIVQVNAQAEKLLGYPRSELLGQPVEILIPERYRSRHGHFRGDFIHDPTSRPMGAGLELFAVDRAGKEFPVEISLSAFGSGDEILVCAAIRDISDRKAADRELEAARAEAERSSFAKTRLLTVASHDLRQPLQAANMYLHVLARQLPDPPEVVHKLRDCLASCAGLLDQLLDISKLDSGATAPSRISCSLAGIQDRLVNAVRPLADEKGLELRVVRSSVSIDTDPQLLEQMLRNLLVNAVRYTDSGRVVFGARREAGGLRIEVWDTGVGIPADRIDRIFDDFYRVEEQASRRQGLGVGLGIVKRIAELLQHPVTVRSTLGRGTTFRVEVPLSESAAVLGAGQAEATESAASSILVIDDDPSVLESVRLSLESCGYRVVAAGSQLAALEALRQSALRLDAVVTDFQLGDQTNGLDTLELLRAELGWKVPGVVLTGDTSGGRLHQLAIARGIEVLHKPVTPVDLAAALDRCLGSSRTA